MKLSGLRFGSRHVLVLAALLLGAIALLSTETYTTRYQTLAPIDWLESRPPLAQSGGVPSATGLAQGLLRASPLLVIRDDVRPLRPFFGPPSSVQRTVGGVRDAARIQLGAPGTFTDAEVPISARLDVIVFNRALRASAWADLMAFAMDDLDPFTGLEQVRVSPTDAGDNVWLVAPRAGGGIATVVGTRGPVGFVLQVTYQRPDSTSPEDRVDLSARAETAARQSAAEWTSWLEAQLAQAGVAS